jgi:ribulose-bisphosphate carboxylase large chain
MSRIEARYRLRLRGEEARGRAQLIAYEQTVELPPHLVTDPHVLERVVGEVEEVLPDPLSSAHSLAWISYPVELAGGQLPQLLNLVYGNVSILPDVRLVELRLPDEFLARFEGPRLGIQGLRKKLGVWERPLLATALKPRGTAHAELARRAAAFARGGGDLVKDDQNLVDRKIESFRERVSRCAEAVHEANQRDGGHCLYFPHIGASAGDADRRLEVVRELGLTGVLVCPFVVGLDTVRDWLGRHRLALMAHPSLTGSMINPTDTGMGHELLLGSLFRLAGADISIFPNFGGRFSFSASTCMAIADALRRDMGPLRAALPCPAGGMGFERLDDMCRTYGRDAMLLIGGSLLGHGSDLERSTRAFLERIESRFPSTPTSS